MEGGTGYDCDIQERLIHMMDQYEKDILRMCCAYLHDRALAQDAVQETFLKAYQGLGGFRGDCSEKSRLTRIAINTCKDVLRSKWYRAVELRFTNIELPPPAYGADEESIELSQAIMRLPARFREVVLLYYYQNLNMTETAQALNVSVAAVSRRLKQARAKLRLTLEGGVGDE